MSDIAVAYADRNGRITIRAESQANYSLGLPLVRRDREAVSEAVTALAESGRDDALYVPGVRQSDTDTTKAILEFSERLIKRVQGSEAAES